MKTHKTNDLVSRGVYLALTPPDICFVGSDGEALEGREGVSYTRIPSILALALSPVLGGLFVALFPLLVFGALIVMIGQVASDRVGHAVRQQAPLLRMQGAPVASYLNREGEEGETTEESDELEILDAEVQSAREEEDEDAS